MQDFKHHGALFAVFCDVERQGASEAAVGQTRQQTCIIETDVTLAGQVTLTPKGIATYATGSRSYERFTDFGEFPVWLPDSRRILFVEGGRHLHVLDTATKQIRKIYTAVRGVLGPPRLTRDGRTAYFTRRMTESDIWLMKIE